MENNSIINWDLHRKIVEKKYGIKPIKDRYDFNGLEDEYRTKNKRIFSIQNISKIDDNTVVLECYLHDRKKYYVNTENHTIHNDIPTNPNNEVTLMCEYIWVVKSISDFITQEENRVGDYKNLLTDLLKKEKN